MFNSTKSNNVLMIWK